MQPLVTVAIPTYNRPEGLKRALNHLQKQSYKNVEVVISDNGSNNYEDPRFGGFFDNYRNAGLVIHYIKQEKNIGMRKNFDFLSAQGQGKYFAFHADDDYWSETYIEEAVKIMEADPTIVSVAAKLSGSVSPDFIDASAKKRIRHFLKNLVNTSHFYSLKPRWVAVKIAPLDRCMSFDTVYIAECLKYGKMITTLHTFHHISTGGASRTPADMVRAMGLPQYYKYINAINLMGGIYRRLGIMIALYCFTRKWWWRDFIVMGVKRPVLNLIIGRDTLKNAH